MEIWLDTADLNSVKHANDLGILHGVTTNPTILSNSKICPQDVIESLIELQQGPVAVQVLSDDVDAMCQQAKALFAVSPRILVKIPVTQNGLKAIHTLAQKGIPTLATAVFELQQALFAFKAGASYIAPYLGRIADTGQNPLDVISKMHAMKLHFGFSGKIMGAGIRDLTTTMDCLKIGLDAVTLSDKVFAEFVGDSEHTLKAMEKFSTDWSKSIFSKASFYSLDVSISK